MQSSFPTVSFPVACGNCKRPKDLPPPYPARQSTHQSILFDRHNASSTLQTTSPKHLPNPQYINKLPKHQATLQFISHLINSCTTFYPIKKIQSVRTDQQRKSNIKRPRKFLYFCYLCNVFNHQYSINNLDRQHYKDDIYRYFNYSYSYISAQVRPHPYAQEARSRRPPAYDIYRQPTNPVPRRNSPKIASKLKRRVFEVAERDVHGLSQVTKWRQLM